MSRKDNQPVRPLSELPYFHGVLSAETVSSRIHIEGDYLLFLNVGNHSRPTIALRTVQEGVVLFEIHQRRDGTFHLPNVNNESVEPFYSIEALIRYHYDNGMLTDDNCCHRLRRYCPDARVLAEQCLTRSCSFSNLPYFLQTIEDEHLDKWLKADGDYLVRYRGDSLQLCVYWYGQICTLRKSILQASCLTRYLLPRDKLWEPTETVGSLDHFLKAMVRGGFPIEGVVLKRAVNKYVVENSKELPTAMFVQVHCQAQLPLHKLPYYHGIATRMNVSRMLKCVGDYCLFLRRTKDHPLRLAVRDRMALNFFRLEQVEPGWVRLPGAGNFATVGELVQHYKTRGIPLKNAEGFRLLNLGRAVERADDSLPELAGLQNESNIEQLVYYHGELNRLEALRRLCSDGDFLLRKDNNGRLLICVKWLDRCRNLPVAKPFQRHLYKLHSLLAIKEYVRTLDEFIKSLVRTGQPIRGVVLKRPVNDDR